METFLVSLRISNYQQLLENYFKEIGFPDRYTLIDNIQPGDKLVLYIGSGKSLVAGILEVTSNIYWNNELIWDEFFPKRVTTMPQIILPMNKAVDMRKIKNGLTFINPDIKKYGSYFMKGVRKLSLQDYEYLKEKILEANNVIR